MFNNEIDYARSRILGTHMLLRDGSNLLRIEEISRSGDSRLLEDAKVYCRDSKGKEIVQKIANFKFSVGGLGYVNSKTAGASLFISRMPVRRDWRQGLRYSQLAAIERNSSVGVSSDWFNMNISALHDCLVEKFPKILDAVELIEETGGSVAFSKNFAISSTFKLLYQGNIVGKLNTNNTLKLGTEFGFLEQELAEKVGHEQISRN